MMRVLPALAATVLAGCSDFSGLGSRDRSEVKLPAPIVITVGAEDVDENKLDPASQSIGEEELTTLAVEPQAIAHVVAKPLVVEAETTVAEPHGGVGSSTKGDSTVVVAGGASEVLEGEITVANWAAAAPLREWKYLVLHHTATATGDVDSIHQIHLRNKDRSGNRWLGIGYHFVIGNGAGMTDGEIAPTFRWHGQLHGAHAGAREFNDYGIGIVLVGNFAKKPPTAAQLSATKRLVSHLAKEFQIDSSHIIGHGTVKATECPGRHFPMDDVRKCLVTSHEGGFEADTPHSTPQWFFAVATPRRTKGSNSQ
jgi:hypothetical protein